MVATQQNPLWLDSVERGLLQLAAPHRISGRQTAQPGPCTARNNACGSMTKVAGLSSRSCTVALAAAPVATGHRMADVPAAALEKPKASPLCSQRWDHPVSGCHPLACTSALSHPPKAPLPLGFKPGGGVSEYCSQDVWGGVSSSFPVSVVEEEVGGEGTAGPACMPLAQVIILHL